MHSKKATLHSLFLFMLLSLSLDSYAGKNDPGSCMEKQTIKVLYIPLADHYASLVAYERYGDKMKYTDTRFVYEEIGKAIKND